MLIVWRKIISAASGSFNVPRKVDKSAKVTSLMAATVNVTTRLENVNSSTRKLVDLTQENVRNASVELNFANKLSTSFYKYKYLFVNNDRLESRPVRKSMRTELTDKHWKRSSANNEESCCKEKQRNRKADRLALALNS